MSVETCKPSPEIQAILDKAAIPKGLLSFSEIFQRLRFAGMGKEDADHWAGELAEPQKATA